MATCLRLAGPGRFWKLSLCWSGLPGSPLGFLASVRAPVSLVCACGLAAEEVLNPVTAVSLSGKPVYGCLLRTS